MRPSSAPLARCPFIRILLALTAPVLALPAQGSPQYDGLGTFSRGNGSGCPSAVHLSAHSQWRGASLALLPAPVSGGTSYEAKTLAAAFGFRTSTDKPWRFEASGAVGHVTSNCASLSEWPRQYVQLSRALGSGGVAISGGGHSLSTLDPSRDRQGLTLSVWQRLRGARVSFDVRAHDASAQTVGIFADTVFGRLPGSGRDTLLWGYLRLADTVNAHTQQRAVDLRTRLAFNVGRVAFDLTGGGTIGRTFSSGVANSLNDSSLASTRADNPAQRFDPIKVQMWGRADARLPLASFVNMAVGVAALPAQPLLGSPPRRVLSIGLGITRWPTTSSPRATHAAALVFESVRTDTSHVLFRFRAPAASQVLLSGEPTQWRPVEMRRLAGDWWEATVQVAAGTYRININIDGAGWQPPPGMPTVRDEFGGEVGVVVVR